MHPHPLLDRRTEPSAPAHRYLPHRRIPQRALADFTRRLAVMVGARLPLVEALKTTAQQCGHRRLQQALHEIQHAVRGGQRLSDAFARHPDCFNAFYVQLLRVGERAGILDQVLLRLALYVEKSALLRRKVRLALAYPAMVLTVALGATLFLLTTIVPTFAQMFADFGASLPAPTRFILSVSGLASDHYVSVLFVLGTLAVAARAAYSMPGGRWMWDLGTLHLPLFGTLLRKSLVARFCRTLGTLLASGVPLDHALELLARAAGNRVAEQEVEHLLRCVHRGSSLNAPLQQTRFFPPMVVQMIAVGEATAALDPMLLQAAAYYEQEVDMAVEGLTAVIEPVLIVLIGLVLGGILVALYLPMFDLINVVG